MTFLSDLTAACDALASDKRYAKKTRALAAALKTWATTLEASMTYTLIPAGNYADNRAGEVFDLADTVTAAIVHLAAAHSGGTNKFYIQLYSSHTDSVDEDGYLADSVSFDAFGYLINPDTGALVLAPTSYAVNATIGNGAISKNYGVVLPRYVQANLFFDNPVEEGETATISDFELTT